MSTANVVQHATELDQKLHILNGKLQRKQRAEKELGSARGRKHQRLVRDLDKVSCACALICEHSKGNAPLAHIYATDEDLVKNPQPWEHVELAMREFVVESDGGSVEREAAAIASMKSCHKQAASRPVVDRGTMGWIVRENMSEGVAAEGHCVLEHMASLAAQAATRRGKQVTPSSDSGRVKFLPRLRSGLNLSFGKFETKEHLMGSTVQLKVRQNTKAAQTSVPKRDKLVAEMRAPSRVRLADPNSGPLVLRGPKWGPRCGPRTGPPFACSR